LSDRDSSSLFGSTLSGSGLWFSIALIVATVAVYSRVPEFEFVTWDDPSYITTNAHVLNGLSWENVRWAFTTDHPPYWHPLTWLSHMTDVQIFGMNAGGHHWVSLLLHVLNTVLLFGLLRAMTGAIGRSAAVAALFALHPLHVESVAWVAERKDVLSTLFWILTVWEYYRYVKRPGAGRYWLMLTFFALGLMAKPMLVTLPFVLLLLDIWPLSRFRPSEGTGQGALWLRLVREKLPLFLLAALSSVITFALQPRIGSLGGLESLSLGYRLQNSVVSYIAYLGKMIWPENLAALYPLKAHFAIWVPVVCGVILVGITVAAKRLAAKHPYLIVGWLWYLGTLIPVIGLVQAGDQAMADRFTYVPLIGIFVAIVWGSVDLIKLGKFPELLLQSVLAAVLVGFAFVAHAQAGHWKSSMALWTHTLDVTTNNHRAENLMGNELLNRGNMRDAAAHYREALRIKPDFADAHNGLGSAYQAQNQKDSAIAQYLEALRLKPDQPEAHNNLGNLLVDAGDVASAIAHYNAGLRISPESPELHNGLGAAYASEARNDEALAEFLKALSLRPDADTEFNVGIIYVAKQNNAEAIKHFEAALRLDPSHQQAREQLNFLRGVPAFGEKR
jgi:Flp pilus assembly protein TadD